MTPKQERSRRALHRYVGRLIRDSEAAYQDWLKRNYPLNYCAAAKPANAPTGAVV